MNEGLHLDLDFMDNRRKKSDCSFFLFFFTLTFSLKENNNLLLWKGESVKTEVRTVC